MAEQPERMHIDMHAHILPLLDLCRYAAMASSAFEDLTKAGGVLPDFKRQLHAETSSLMELSDYGGGNVVAAGVWIAMEFLREYESQSADKGG